MATKNAKSATSEKASVKPAKDTAVKAADVKPAVKDVCFRGFFFIIKRRKICLQYTFM